MEQLRIGHTPSLTGIQIPSESPIPPIPGHPAITNIRRPSKDINLTQILSPSLEKFLLHYEANKSLLSYLIKPLNFLHQKITYKLSETIAHISDLTRTKSSLQMDTLYDLSELAKLELNSTIKNIKSLITASLKTTSLNHATTRYSTESYLSQTILNFSSFIKEKLSELNFTQALPNINEIFFDASGMLTVNHNSQSPLPSFNTQNDQLKYFTKGAPPSPVPQEYEKRSLKKSAPRNSNRNSTLRMLIRKLLNGSRKIVQAILQH